MPGCGLMGAAPARSGAAGGVADINPLAANILSTLLQPGAGAAASTANTQANTQQLVITDPNRLVPVQITIPAQPGNPTSQPRALTVQVPAHALQQQGPTSALLQQVLTQAITTALNLPQDSAERHLQSQINNAFSNQRS